VSDQRHSVKFPGEEGPSFVPDPIGGACGISEIVWQSRGESGGRQQEGAKAGNAHVIGLTSACTINVMTA